MVRTGPLTYICTEKPDTSPFVIFFGEKQTSRVAFCSFSEENNRKFSFQKQNSELIRDNFRFTKKNFRTQSK